MERKANEKSLLDRFIEWREKHISQRQFILFLSFVVGVIYSASANGRLRERYVQLALSYLSRGGYSYYGTFHS